MSSFNVRLCSSRKQPRGLPGIDDMRRCMSEGVADDAERCRRRGQADGLRIFFVIVFLTRLRRASKTVHRQALQGFAGSHRIATHPSFTPLLLPLLDGVHPHPPPDMAGVARGRPSGVGVRPGLRVHPYHRGPPLPRQEAWLVGRRRGCRPLKGRG